MARRTFNAMISLPIDLEPLWSSLGNKSKFVTDHLRLLGGAEVKHEHHHYPAGKYDRRVLGMCNPHVAICPVCIQQFEFGIDQAVREWNRRVELLDAPKYINSDTGKIVSARQYIGIHGIDNVAGFGFDWDPLGDEEE